MNPSTIGSSAIGWGGGEERCEMRDVREHTPRQASSREIIHMAYEISHIRPSHNIVIVTHIP